MKSIVLIVFPLVMIAAVGMLYNAYTNAGLGSGSGSCSLWYCTIANYNGVVGSQFTAANFQVLSPTSPFTNLLAGRITDFLFSFFNSNPAYNFGACIDCSANIYCTSTNTGYLCNNFFTTFQPNSCNAPPITFLDANHPLNFTDPQGNNTIWNIYGASATIDVNCAPHVVQNSGAYTGMVSAYCYVKTYSNPTTHKIICQPPSTMSATNSFNGIFGFFTFIAGILLLLIGLGIQFSASALASGLSFGSNPQGSKLAQTFGIFLIFFGFIYSEFSNWLWVLPYSIGAVLLSLFLVISGIGLYWRTQSYD